MGVVTKNLNAIRPREILLVIQKSEHTREYLIDCIYSKRIISVFIPTQDFPFIILIRYLMLNNNFEDVRTLDR
jgi:hypothetical protein